MLPKVVLHNAVSLDGRIDGFTVDMGLFYGLASQWREDATLAGCDTLLAATPPDPGDVPEPSEPQPGDARPLLVVPDSRGRLRSWDYWRAQSYWRQAVALCSRATPGEYLDYLREHNIEYIVAGDDHVDYRAALEELNTRHEVRVVRVDSGGTLNGALLRAGLVDEVSVLVHPVLIGGTTPRSLFRAPNPASAEDAVPLHLLHLERLEGDVVWLRWQVKR
jgi:2,5-diamino-6-(ribosylamino)-4(3H)-pyrimidinone 5'-phosphate reductase